MKLIKYFSLISILVIAFGVRIFNLSDSPKSVNWDEAALGYNSYSLLHTGRDEFGKIFPVSLRSFDDYKPALYTYFSTLPVLIFGLNEISTRLTSVIFGTLLAYFVTYIGAKITSKFSVGMLSGLVIAVSPWSMHFSKIAFEANLANSLLFSFIALFLHSLAKPKTLYLATTLGILSTYAYHAQRAIFAPLFILLVLSYRKKISLTSNNIVTLLLTSLLLFMPLVYSFLTEPAGSRLSSTIILKLWPLTPPDSSVLVFNPIYTLVWQLIGQFLAYFSPINIFIKGSIEPILNIPKLGLYNLEFFFFWVIGLVITIKSIRLRKLLLPLLVLSPLPGAITWNWFSVIRTLSLYTTYALIIGIGIHFSFSLLKPKLLKIVSTIILGLFFLLSFWWNFLTITLYAPYETFGNFQPGFEKSIPYLISESKKYDRVIIESPHIAPYIFLLFYGQYSPEKYLDEAGLHRKNSGTENYSFGKFEFRKLTRDEIFGSNILIMGPTTTIPDWRKEQAEKDGLKVVDFFDPHGYISFRIMSL